MQKISKISQKITNFHYLCLIGLSFTPYRYRVFPTGGYGDLSFCEEEESFSNPPEFQEIIPCGNSRKVEGKKVGMVDRNVQTEPKVLNYCPEIRKG